jgi:hypothetical protein
MKPKNAAEHSVSAQDALQAAGKVKGRGGPADVLQVTLAALEATAAGRQEGLDLGRYEAALLHEHLQVLVVACRSTRQQLAVMERKRNEAVERAGVAEAEVLRLKGRC